MARKGLHFNFGLEEVGARSLIGGVGGADRAEMIPPSSPTRLGHDGILRKNEGASGSIFPCLIISSMIQIIMFLAHPGHDRFGDGGEGIPF